MVRVIGFLVGLGFVGILLISFFVNLSNAFSNPEEPTAEHEFHKHPKALALASDGPLGKFDERQLQRGFQVYAEVCAACHGLGLVAFRDLQALGYNEAEVKKIAADWKTQVPSINPDTGEATGRKAVASDTFPQPFANEVAARAANNNAYPPDLSLIAKAREGGAAYTYSLLTGYRNPVGYKNEKGEELLKEFPAARPGPGLHFNPYFPNLNIAMPPPLTSTGQVSYADGTPATVDQMSKDVSAFLVWAAEPKLQRRHSAGLAVSIFLLIATILGYLAYREMWSHAKRQVRVAGPLEPENQAKSKSAKAKAGIEG
jgi:ubiquinol-cytochrome c reductase cytochrome c1 subunit